MSIPKPIIEQAPYIESHSILVGFRGSIAHGMYIPSDHPNSVDDKDVMAIIVPEMDYYIGLKEWGSRGTKELYWNEWDVVSYEIKKFIRLLLKGNPNVLCMLWLDDNYYIKRTCAGDLLIENRDIFVSKQVYHSFCGYAYQQLERMTHFKYEGYMGEKRKQLVDKYKFDVKNGAHCIRLLRMGIEFLNEGELYVTRKDAPQLLAIKKGEWTLEQVKTEADALFQRLHATYDNCKLPSKPDYEKANSLCMKIINDSLTGAKHH